MKKIIIILSLLIFLTGCESTLNTPTKKVENFLSEYQNLNPEVLKKLERSVEADNLSKSQRKKYIGLLEKQYQNLSYKIVNEVVNDDNAIVDVEIEVLNYTYSIADSKKYYETHKDEIKDYNEYMLNNLEKVKDKIKYNISIDLTKYDGNWELNEIDRTIIQKIHGLY